MRASYFLIKMWNFPTFWQIPSSHTAYRFQRHCIALQNKALKEKLSCCCRFEEPCMINQVLKYAFLKRKPKTIEWEVIPTLHSSSSNAPVIVIRNIATNYQNDSIFQRIWSDAVVVLVLMVRVMQLWYLRQFYLHKII